MRLSLLHRLSVALLMVSAIAVTSRQASAAELFGLTPGPVELKSAGPLSFGPSGVLFVGDPMAAKIYAINTEDKKGVTDEKVGVRDLAGHVSKAFGGGKATIVDLAVNPETGTPFLSVTVDGKPGIARVTGSTVRKVDLDKIGHGFVSLPNPPADKAERTRRGMRNKRGESITDLVFSEGRVLVSGLSADDSPSSVREFDFPFREHSRGMQVEIYHAAHGATEDSGAIQTFIPFTVGGEATILAGYVCTPLVKIPLKSLNSKSKVTGTTVAELGNRNKPYDMVAYEKGGKDFILIANSRRGVMKVSTDNLAKNKGLTEPVRGGKTAGQTYETISDLKGVTQLAALSDVHALVVIEADGKVSLEAIDLP